MNLERNKFNLENVTENRDSFVFSENFLVFVRRIVTTLAYCHQSGNTLCLFCNIYSLLSGAVFSLHYTNQSSWFEGQRQRIHITVR